MAEATAVLDASALLAFPRREPGFEVVLDAIGQGALMSAVNWAEVLTKLGDLGEDLQRAVAEIESQGVLGSNLRIVAFGHDEALVCAQIRSRTRDQGLCLGDRACLALGRVAELPVITADRHWSSVRVGVEIQQIR